MDELYRSIYKDDKDFKAASELLDECFKDKVDKGGVPYKEHCCEVANSIVRYVENGYCKHVLVIAAMLHDVMEDCPEITRDVLAEKFDKNIADIVVAVTRTKDENYDEYIHRVIFSGTPAMIIKLYDLRHNMDMSRLRVITDKDIERVKKYHNAYTKILNMLRFTKVVD